MCTHHCHWQYIATVVTFSHEHCETINASPNREGGIDDPLPPHTGLLCSFPRRQANGGRGCGRFLFHGHCQGPGHTEPSPKAVPGSQGHPEWTGIPGRAGGWRSLAPGTRHHHHLAQEQGTYASEGQSLQSSAGVLEAEALVQPPAACPAPTYDLFPARDHLGEGFGPLQRVGRQRTSSHQLVSRGQAGGTNQCSF